VTVAKKQAEAKLDKGRLKRLHQEDETWEADFRALPKPLYQNPTHYRGIVVTKKGDVLAESHVEARPEASDLAALFTQAVQRTATGLPRALDYGGMPFEDDRPETLAEAMAVLEQGLAEYIKREGIE
jgi:hypothetical protein